MDPKSVNTPPITAPNRVAITPNVVGLFVIFVKL